MDDREPNLAEQFMAMVDKSLISEGELDILDVLLNGENEEV